MSEKNYADFPLRTNTTEVEECHPRKYDRHIYTSLSRPTPKPKSDPDAIIYPVNEEIHNSYYLDIKKMSDKQIAYFKKYAKFEKMTVYDYINWLILNEGNLSEYNSDMLFNHKQGYKLIPEDIPKKQLNESDRLSNELLNNFRISPTRL